MAMKDSGEVEMAKVMLKELLPTRQNKYGDEHGEASSGSVEVTKSGEATESIDKQGLSPTIDSLSDEASCNRLLPEGEFAIAVLS